MKRVIVFLGLPGAGKGTQAKLYSEKNNLAHISTGEMLRAAVHSGTELGLKVKQIIESGQLVSDALMLEIISERIKRPDCENGFILDGFPRTTPQAEFLNKTLGEITCAVYFELSEEEVVKRMTERSAKEGRADDSRNTQFERIKVYRDQTEPLVEYYRARAKLAIVDALGSIEEVSKKLEMAVSKFI